MARFGPKVWEGHGLEVYVTLKQAPRQALPRWLQVRQVGRRLCTRLAVVLVTGTAEREVATRDLRGKTHGVGDLAKWVSSHVRQHGSRQANEALIVRAYHFDPDLDEELDVGVFHWHPKVWLRIEGTDGSTIRLYESLAYARSADICMEHDASLRPRTRRRTGPRPK
jgi:hypothetical protein